MCVVVPSNMNPVGAEGNMFANLFDKVPAKRAGKLEDISGTVLYLCSQAGVSEFFLRIVFQHADPYVCRHTWMDAVSVSMAGESWLPMDRNKSMSLWKG